MFESKTTSTARRVAFVFIALFVGVIVLGFIDYQFGLFPRLDSEETQREAGEVASEAQELLRDRDVPEIGEWKLYSMSKSWSRIGGPRDGGSFRYSINGHENHLITVEWELRQGERVITSIASTKADEALYEIVSD